MQKAPKNDSAHVSLNKLLITCINGGFNIWMDRGCLPSVVAGLGSVLSPDKDVLADDEC